jgi:hypothetical protein
MADSDGIHITKEEVEQATADAELAEWQDFKQSEFGKNFLAEFDKALRGEE